MKVVFLDIDGVLLSNSSWALPENVALLEKQRTNPQYSGREAAGIIRFNPVAVALVNRLCGFTGALSVVHSTWRGNIGGKDTRAKLLEQRIEERFMHRNWVCPIGPGSEKSQDILRWLRENRVAPNPQAPGTGTERETSKTNEACHHPVEDYGIEFVVLDDEPIQGMEGRQILVDDWDGFCTDFIEWPVLF